MLFGVLVALPVREHGPRRGGDDVAEDVRVARDELVMHLPGDVRQVEQALLLGERGVEEHLAKEVAELL